MNRPSLGWKGGDGGFRCGARRLLRLVGRPFRTPVDRGDDRASTVLHEPNEGVEWVLGS